MDTRKPDSPKTLKELSHEDDAPPDVARGYEVRDLGPKYFVWMGVLLAVLLVLGHVVAGVIFFAKTGQAKKADRPAPSLADAVQIAPGPLLQVVPAQDLAEMQHAEQQKLSTYDWEDRAKGTIRIPIDRAMDLLVERGLPVRPPASQPSATP